MSEHRYAAALRDVADKLLRATGDDQIDLIFERKHLLHIGACVKQVDRIGRNILEARQDFGPNLNQDSVAVLSFRSTF